MAASVGEGQYSAGSALIGGGNNFWPIHTFWATVLQVVTMIIYVVLTFALPKSDDFFKTSNHITVLHAVCWLIILACGGWVERETRRALHVGHLSLYRRMRLPGHFPVILTTFLNFAMLVLLGLDTWIEAETGDDPISVVVLQWMACVEAVVLCIVAVYFIRLIWSHNTSKRPVELNVAQMMGQGDDGDEETAGGGDDAAAGAAGGRSGYGGVSAASPSLQSMDRSSMLEIVASRTAPVSARELQRAQGIIESLRREKAKLERELTRSNMELARRMTGQEAGDGSQTLLRLMEQAEANRTIASKRADALVVIRDALQATQEDNAVLQRKLDEALRELSHTRQLLRKAEVARHVDRATHDQVRDEIEAVRSVAAAEAAQGEMELPMHAVLAAGDAHHSLPADAAVSPTLGMRGASISVRRSEEDDDDDDDDDDVDAAAAAADDLIVSSAVAAATTTSSSSSSSSSSVAPPASTDASQQQENLADPPATDTEMVEVMRGRRKRRKHKKSGRK